MHWSDNGNNNSDNDDKDENKKLWSVAEKIEKYL